MEESKTGMLPIEKCPLSVTVINCNTKDVTTIAKDEYLELMFNNEGGEFIYSIIMCPNDLKLYFETPEHCKMMGR